MRGLCLMTMVVFAVGVGVAEADDAPFRFTGDARAGWVGAETRARDGAVTDHGALKARIRPGLTWSDGTHWTFAVRGAWVMDTDVPAPGHADVDVFNVSYSPGARAWTLAAGRFQANFALEGASPKGLGRNDSPSFDVTWTDALWVTHAGEAWTTHLVVEHRGSDPSSTGLRPPLSFTGDGTPLGVYAGIEASRPAGVFIQRAAGITYLPGALRPRGPGSAVRDDYLAATVRAAAGWRFGHGGARIVFGAEAGYAPNTPRRTVMGTGAGDADGAAWQVALSVLDAWPAHRFGLVYGKAADGWLIANDFRPNEALAEARWAWHVAPSWTIDARVRRREETRVAYPALVPRRVLDADFRVNLRF